MEKREEEERKTAAQRKEEEEEEEEEEEGKMTTAQEEEEDEEEEEEEGTMTTAQGEEEEEGAAADRPVEDAAVMKKKMIFKDSKFVPGIVYIGHIPPKLRPKHLRNMLSVHGEIGRVFLQPEGLQVRRSKKKSGLRRCDFTEGWVEFRDKRMAKRVALSLHNTQMGNRKRHRFSADLWSIKYLHRFQWTHLSEQLAYQRTVQQQRLRTEVSQAKKETNFYLNNVEISSNLDKNKKKRQRAGGQAEDKVWDFTQRQTEEEIQLRKNKKKDSISQKHLDKARSIQQKSQSNVSLLTKIFNSNQSQ
ncbi:activator of basal transcription 1 [Limanda limanda]|uniref:activator of basal transcription 1 n=1 Tax=Limanda limanda TaxID=27771 RepID=UPI0029C9AA86|nr:activator of basal transcription 1 [Limanda limanda]